MVDPCLQGGLSRGEVVTDDETQAFVTLIVQCVEAPRRP